MALIIAVILILIIGYKVSDDKIKTNAYNAKKAEQDSQHDQWVARYVSQDLEAQINEIISDSSNFEDIKKEVGDVLETLEHWKGYTDTLELYDNYPRYSKDRFETIGRNRQIVLDILLAKRGKVSNRAAIWGYRAYISSGGYYGDNVLKMMQFELVDWIKTTLNQKGCDVELVYSGVGDSRVPLDSYYWVGTRRSLPLIGESNPQRFKPFSRELIDKKGVRLDKI